MTNIIGILITTLGVIATTLIQGIQAKRKDNIDSKLSNIQIALNEEKLDRCKADLINAMSEIHKGANLTEEQRRIIYEEKETYNKLGGDSYVDDMFDRLKKEGKL